MGPGALSEVLKDLEIFKDSNVLVSGSTYDDAGIYQINEDVALVQTVDFFTPMVDDPYSFGKIAITNALSDVYAMGGVPKTALNITTFPVSCLELTVLREILRGGNDKLKEAEVVLLGGHTVEDQEPKYGASITGVVHPNKIWKNQGGLVGDSLVLTKPLGVGLITTAIKGELASDEEIREVTRSMELLNKKAADEARDYDIHGCTDITGFGFLGHLLEMVGDKQTFEVDSSKVPFLLGALEHSKNGMIPQGAERNRKYLQGNITFMVEEYLEIALMTPETSGGLLLALSPKDALSYVKKMKSQGEEAFIIGEIKGFMGEKVVVI